MRAKPAAQVAVVEPEKPTQEEWDEDPEKAAEKLYEYKDFQKTKEAKAEASKKDEQVKTQQQFEDTWNGHIDKIVDDFPQLGEDGSDLNKRVGEILDQNPAFTNHPDGIKWAADLAVAQLGLKPGTSETPAKEEPKEKAKPTNKEKIYLTQVGKSGESEAKEGNTRFSDIKQFQKDEARFISTG